MPFNLKEYHDDFLFAPLGGSNEIGMNLNLYHYQGKWLMVDCGMGFAEDYLPGVEVLVPNIEFVMEIKKDLVGLVLTHAHEDHLGAVPYLWNEIQCPIYATPFTMSLLKHKLKEEGLTNKTKLVEVKPGAKYDLGPFALEMVGLTHSIPEMQAIAIRTEKGVVMHTGDWKFDDQPMLGPQSDEAKLKQYGDEGVLAMVCDSTNVFVEGVSGSESGVRENLTQLIKQCKQRVVVTTFASNLARLETIILAAEAAGRTVALAGRSLWRVTECAKDSGYLKGIKPILTEREAMDVARDKLLLICTGCQGEPMAALTKIARNDHHAIRIAAGDSVIFSSRKIPGNEMRIKYIHNLLITNGIEVFNDNTHDIHVSGHPCRDELARMYQLVRPQIAIPVHGEPMHLHEHVKFARKMQVPETVEVRNGVVVLLEMGNAKMIGQVESGYMAIDGSTLIPTDSPVIRMRRKLRDDGAVFVSIVMDKKTDELLAPPKVTAPGSLDAELDRDLLEALSEEIREDVERMKAGPSTQMIQDAARTAIRRIYKQDLGKKPVIEVQVLKI